MDTDRKKIAPKETRNLEYRISIFEELSSKSSVVFIGDSLTRIGLWNEFFPYITIANRGVGGDKTSDVLKRMDSIISVEPKVAFIMLGLNDILISQNVTTIFSNYKKIIELLIENDIQVVIQSTVQCEFSVCSDKVRSVNELNRLLEKHAIQHDLVYVDLEGLTDTQGLPSSLTYDGVHLNGKGYRLWVRSITPIIKNLNL